MAVVVHVVLPGVTKEQYDQVREAVGWLEERPAGGLSHVTWWEGGDCHNVDAWESEEAFNTFGAERLGPGGRRVPAPGHVLPGPRGVRTSGGEDHGLASRMRRPRPVLFPEARSPADRASAFPPPVALRQRSSKVIAPGTASLASCQPRPAHPVNDRRLHSQVCNRAACCAILRRAGGQASESIGRQPPLARPRRRAGEPLPGVTRQGLADNRPRPREEPGQGRTRAAHDPPATPAPPETPWRRRSSAQMARPPAAQRKPGGERHPAGAGR